MPHTTADLVTTATGADIRLRFCPSPTGTPHVGMVRTALFNWAYARHVGGTLVFRIEDTDAERDSEESYRQIVEALHWLGIDWNEGIDVGGPDAPYRQSERREIYAEVIAKLREGGWLYESYATAEEIAARNVAEGRDPRQGYDNFERTLTDADRARYRDEGRRPSLRLRVPDEDLSFDDLVRGEITFKAGSFSDFVVVRPNGDALYTLVNPVDDALMHITHVLRGEDILSSTPRQIALYHALHEIGVAEFIPRFGHLPYVMGEGNRKLSKRDPESNLFHHRDRGFIREGMLNYLALLGWSIGPDRDVFSMDEMITAFDVHDVNPNPARFDLKKAEAINAAHLRLLDADDFASRLTPYLAKAHLLDDGSADAAPTEAERARIAKAAPLVQERIHVLAEGADMLAFLFLDDDAITIADDARKTLKPGAAEVLAATAEALEPVTDWTRDAIEAALRAALIDRLALKPRLAFGPLRVAVSGRRVSPPLFESLEILGKDATLARVERLRADLAAAG